MSRFLQVAIVTALLAATASAQPQVYTPSAELPNGRQIVAIYFGADFCGACHNTAVKEAVASMKSLVAAQAKKQGASFAAIGVANDWDPKVAANFIASNGAFDQLVLGGNFTNLAVEQFIWRDAKGRASLPQIVVIERTVKSDVRIDFSEPRFLRRVMGADSIPLWVKQGAPISEIAKQ